MGESMDTDHVATVVFAHWPGAASPFYRDLGRMASYGAALGKFVTLTDYFENTDTPNEPSRFKADQYRSPYLRQAVIRQQIDPISTHVREHAQGLAQAGVQALESFGRLLSGATSGPDETANGTSPSSLAEEELQHRREAAGRGFAKAASASSKTPPTGCLVLNPASFARRTLVDVSPLASAPATSGPVVGVQETAGKRQALVEVPPCGFVWLQAGGGALRTAKQPLAEGTTLRTEFFEVIIHPETGGIRSILVPGKRGNRVSQQLAMRLPAARQEPGAVWRDPEENAQYSTMVAESIEVTQAGSLSGQIVSRGRLVDAEQKRLAGFKQTFQVYRGSRVLELDIELDISEQPRADAWSSYYATRFAWADAAAELWRSAGLTAQPTGARRIEAPHFFDIRSEGSRTAILTGGLPYHLFNGDRMLDSLLVVRGESARRFRMGITIDAAHPTADALDLIEPPLVLQSAPLPGSRSGSGWLFHIDARNAVATHWDAICEAGKPVGFRVRLLETEGRSGRIQLRSIRAPSVARQVDFNGQPQVELAVKDDTISVELGRYEWIEVEARWEAGK
jgi:alpha-mannosidase